MTEALRQHFRPEFLNRIDEIVFFHALGLEHMKSIIDIQVHGPAEAAGRPEDPLELTDAAKSALVTEGYDPAYGARPLKRTLQRRILDPLALQMLEGEVREGRPRRGRGGRRPGALQGYQTTRRPPSRLPRQRPRAKG